MKTLLVPIDFSAATPAVVRAAERLAPAIKGRMVLVHSIQMPLAAAEPYGLVYGNIGEYMAGARKAVERHLKRIQAGLRARGIPAETHCITGFPSAGILAMAKKRAVDYIVIGSLGHTVLYDVFIGSTTRGVLKGASCPVLVVPGKRKAAPNPKP
jgi:nucleotide-binding universal stress UspA family protein